ncbi:hypothetical protein D9758_018917 [Tetrapyrgos nigripes]|uniref:Uncharacterized protein n=1 Tax=Tetrapyrgos nigripes TaxID=182062 RepID=A0A8H5F9B0_9AGAR|nr:hypothetical protein D9758_018917 [Tetrapyrgos nigripes]
MCRKLAVSDATGNQNLQFMLTAASNLAKKWKWKKQKAMKLGENLRDYYVCKDPLKYWEELPVTSDKCPLHDMAITIFQIVPSSANVERLLSDLGGVQTPKRNNLNVETFEKLGKMCSSLQCEHLQDEGSLFVVNMATCILNQCQMITWNHQMTSWSQTMRYIGHPHSQE